MTLTRTEIKEEAQDQLLYGLRVAFTSACMDGKSDEILAEMNKQFVRIEKMFGYEPSSNSRGV